MKGICRTVPFYESHDYRTHRESRARRSTLRFLELPEPVPESNELLIRVRACGVCHTELDEIEGRTPPPDYPVVPGHQVVGEVAAAGKYVGRFHEGDRVGVGWIFSSCGKCPFCLSGAENLCNGFKATGRDANGGYSEYMKVHEDYAFRIPGNLSDAEAAPLLCAGAIGYRSLQLSHLQNGQNLGLLGFGASGHLVLKTARHLYPASGIFVFARSDTERKFAAELGAHWTGSLKERSPEKLHCIIDTTPAWGPIVHGLACLHPGGRLVINAIRKEEEDKEILAQIDYPAHLWKEKEIKSVANVTRRDIGEFLTIAAEIPIKPEVEEYRLIEANRALTDLKNKKLRGAKVLKIG